MSKSDERIPLIFDIKRTSTTDGPGVRTVVFLKGCNLNCFWCHNPEGKNPERQFACFADKCIACGTCRKVCLSPENCILCGTCVEYCPVQAKKCYGKEYTPEELLAVIETDREYYLATGGGVTFSGGECMLYPEFVKNIAKRCKERGISVAIDTAGAVPYSHFETVLPVADIFLYDIKCLDDALHRRGTGCGNDRILKNLEILRTTGKTIIIRMPVIPGFNDESEVEKVKEYCRERELPLELLNYHEMGEDKRRALEA